jgi:hypothetical protein
VQVQLMTDAGVFSASLADTRFGQKKNWHPCTVKSYLFNVMLWAHGVIEVEQYRVWPKFLLSYF